jgi:Mycobacterium membrane protein
VTQQTPYPPAQLPQAPQPPRNGLGTTGFILGLVGLIFSPIPIVGMIAWPLVILGAIFSALGISRARKGVATNKVLSIVGLVLSVVGLIVCIVWVAIIGKAASDINEEANRAVPVSYEVSGDAKNVEITYSVYGDSITSKDETAATLPWNKQTETKGLVKGGSLIAMANEDGGTVTCKVTVDGKEVSTNTASGMFAVASCSGF